MPPLNLNLFEEPNLPSDVSIPGSRGLDLFGKFRNQLGISRPQNRLIADILGRGLLEPESTPGFRLGQSLLTERRGAQREALNDMLRRSGLAGSPSGAGLGFLSKLEREGDIDTGRLALQAEDTAQARALNFEDQIQRMFLSELNAALGLDERDTQRAFQAQESAKQREVQREALKALQQMGLAQAGGGLLASGLPRVLANLFPGVFGDPKEKALAELIKALTKKEGGGGDGGGGIGQEAAKAGAGAGARAIVNRVADLFGSGVPLDTTFETVNDLIRGGGTAFNPVRELFGDSLLDLEDAQFFTPDAFLSPSNITEFDLFSGGSGFSNAPGATASGATAQAAAPTAGQFSGLSRFTPEGLFDLAGLAVPGLNLFTGLASGVTTLGPLLARAIGGTPNRSTLARESIAERLRPALPPGFETGAGAGFEGGIEDIMRTFAGDVRGPIAQGFAPLIPVAREIGARLGGGQDADRAAAIFLGTMMTNSADGNQVRQTVRNILGHVPLSMEAAIREFEQNLPAIRATETSPGVIDLLGGNVGGQTVRSRAQFLAGADPGRQAAEGVPAGASMDEIIDILRPSIPGADLERQADTAFQQLRDFNEGGGDLPGGAMEEAQRLLGIRTLTGTQRDRLQAQLDAVLRELGRREE